VAAVLGPVFGVPKVEAETPGADSEDIALLGQIVLNGDVYEHNSISRVAQISSPAEIRGRGAVDRQLWQNCR